MNTLPKSERLCGKVSVSALMSKGRWGFTSGLKYCSSIQPEGDGIPNRIMVSVPKRLFKRAVRRNLLKRRLREAYRTRKELLPPCGASIMFLYNTPEILGFQSITEQVESILKKIGNEREQ